MALLCILFSQKFWRDLWGSAKQQQQQQEGGKKGEKEHINTKWVVIVLFPNYILDNCERGPKASLQIIEREDGLEAEKEMKRRKGWREVGGQPYWLKPFVCVYRFRKSKLKVSQIAVARILLLLWEGTEAHSHTHTHSYSRTLRFCAHVCLFVSVCVCEWRGCSRNSSSKLFYLYLLLCLFFLSFASCFLHLSSCVSID